MRLTAFVIMMFSISLVMYFMGFQSPILYLWNNQGGTYMQPQCVATNNSACLQSGAANIVGNALVPGGDTILAGLTGLALVGVVASLLGGFSAVYILPLLIVSAVLGYLILPVSMLFSLAMPDVVRIPLIVLYNILVVITVVGFVRGQA